MDIKRKLTSENLCRRWLAPTAVVLAGLWANGAAHADGIVAKIVNSPLNSAGLVKGTYTAINVYLQKPDARGIEFFNPKVAGFGIPPGGRIEVEMGGGFTRVPAVKLDTSAIHMVSGTPQHGLSSKRLGYVSREGNNKNTYIVTALSTDGLPPEKLLPRASVQKLDPIPNVGLKVFHIGLGAIAFTNKGDTGSVTVRIVDRNGKILQSGSAKVNFWDQTLPQIHPNNFLHKGRNHIWQRIKPGETLGRTPGTVPMTFMLFDKAFGSDTEIREHRKGITGAGVISSKQLIRIGFRMPAEIARYNAGLIIRDSNGDGRLDPLKDQIIGGVSIGSPGNVGAYELGTLEAGGAPVLSQPTSDLAKRAGKRFGGAILQVQFQAGTKAGVYRPKFALLRDPNNLNSGDGTSYIYTVIVE